MDVRLTDEQKALRDAAAQLVDRLGPRSVADLGDAERRAKLDAAVAASGWRELRAADLAWQPSASAVEVAIVAEEFGRGLVDTAFIGPTLAAELRRVAGSSTPTPAETVALTADLGSLAAAGADEPAGLAGGIVAIDAAGASKALLRLDGNGGPGVGEVGLTAADDPGVDLTRPIVPATTTLLAPGPDGSLSDPVLVQWTAFGLALTCADLVGVMRGTIALAVDYAGVRQQYGVVIGSFQAVQHLLADAFVAMEGSRSVARHAAWAVDALPASDALAAAATAKAYCARAARMVCETSIQVHGGIGNTWECLAHVFLRRALMSIDVFGGVGVNLERVLAHHELQLDRLVG